MQRWNIYVMLYQLKTYSKNMNVVKQPIPPLQIYTGTHRVIDRKSETKSVAL